MMNYLISAYSVNPYKGSEDSIGWNWVLQYEKNYKEGDRIILLTKKFNEKDTRRGLKEFNIQHVELVIVDVPNALNWFREKHSAFHHIYYILPPESCWGKCSARCEIFMRLRISLTRRLRSDALTRM